MTRCPPHRTPGKQPMSRSTRSIRRRGSASRSFMRIARWRRSGGAALVGSGGRAEAGFRRTALLPDRLLRLRGVPPRDDCTGGDQLLMQERLANIASPSMCRAWDRRANKGYYSIRACFLLFKQAAVLLDVFFPQRVQQPAHRAGRISIPVG
jgi:hypothetical protein